MNNTFLNTNIITQISNRYKFVFRRSLNLSDPRLFTEKLQYLKIYEDISLKVICADKFLLKKHLCEEKCKELSLPTIQVIDSINETLLNYNNCIIKCNHGSGMNILVKDKIQNRDLIILDNWLKMDYSMRCFEPWYHYIKPKIIIEPIIKNIKDIEVFCFNGEPLFYQYGTVHENYSNYYDLKWNFIKEISRKVCKNDSIKIDPRPKKLDEIYYYSKKLSKPFKFVRVDFIFNENELYCNELTFCPGGGFQVYEGNGDLLIGNMLKI